MNWTPLTTGTAEKIGNLYRGKHAITLSVGRPQVDQPKQAHLDVVGVCDFGLSSFLPDEFPAEWLPTELPALPDGAVPGLLPLHLHFAMQVKEKHPELPLWVQVSAPEKWFPEYVELVD